MRYILLRNILLLLSTWLLFTGCRDYKKLEFKSYEIEKIDNISFGKGSVSATLTLIIEVANPTPTTFTAKDLEATISVSYTHLDVYKRQKLIWREEL